MEQLCLLLFWSILFTVIQKNVFIIFQCLRSLQIYHSLIINIVPFFQNPEETLPSLSTAKLDDCTECHYAIIILTPTFLKILFVEISKLSFCNKCGEHDNDQYAIYILKISNY